MTRETGSDPSQDQQEQKEQIVDKLEQYLQRIEEGKSDQVIADIVRVQGEYVNQRVELTDEQGEEIKQLAIEFIKRLSELDLEKLVHEPWLIASMYERERDEGLGDSDSTHETDERFRKNPKVSSEASAKLVFLAYATKTLGELKEEFLQEYLDNSGGSKGYFHLSPQEVDIRYVFHNENGSLEEGEFKHANPAFVKFTEQYRQAWERAQELKKTSLEFKGLIYDPKNKNSPAYDEAVDLGAFYGTWGNGIGHYFMSDRDKKTGAETMKSYWGYDKSGGFFHNLYSYSFRNIDEQGIVHLDRKRETK